MPNGSVAPVNAGSRLCGVTVCARVVNLLCLIFETILSFVKWVETSIEEHSEKKGDKYKQHYNN